MKFFVDVGVAGKKININLMIGHIFLTITSNDPSLSFSGRKEAQQEMPPW